MLQINGLSLRAPNGSVGRTIYDYIEDQIERAGLDLPEEGRSGFALGLLEDFKFRADQLVLEIHKVTKGEPK